MATTKRAIDILLKEYDTLRTELISRMNAGFQLLALILIEVGACTGLIEKFGLHKPTKWLIVIFAVANLFVFYVLNDAIGKCNKRVKEIEEHVNQLAGIRLLCWENRFGAGRKWYLPTRPGPDGTGQPMPPSDRWKTLDPEPNPSDRKNSDC